MLHQQKTIESPSIHRPKRVALIINIILAIYILVSIITLSIDITRNKFEPIDTWVQAILIVIWSFHIIVLACFSHFAIQSFKRNDPRVKFDCCDNSSEEILGTLLVAFFGFEIVISGFWISYVVSNKYDGSFWIISLILGLTFLFALALILTIAGVIIPFAIIYGIGYFFRQYCYLCKGEEQIQPSVSNSDTSSVESTTTVLTIIKA